MSEKPSQETREVDGVNYTFQKLPTMNYLELRDRCKSPTGSMLDSKFYPEVLEKIVVAANDEYKKLTPNDFEDFSHMDRVVGEAVKFQQGGK